MVDKRAPKCETILKTVCVIPLSAIVNGRAAQLVLHYSPSNACCHRKYGECNQFYKLSGVIVVRLIQVILK